MKLTLLLTACLTIMAGATISPSLPGITDAFSSTPNVELLSRLVLTLPALFVAVSSPLIGRLADRAGRIPLLAGSVVLYGLAGSSGLLMDSVYGLLVGRAFLGIAVAGIMTLSTALAGDYFEGTERDRYMGLQQAFTGFGGLVFLTAGGVLAGWDWRYPFALYSLALPLAPLVWRFLFEPPKNVPQRSADNIGNRHTGRIAALCCLALLVSGSFYIIPSQLPYQLNELGITEPSLAGVAMGLMTLTAALASLTFGMVRERLGSLTVFALGICGMAAGLGLIGWSNDMVGIMCGTGATGLAQGLLMPNIFSRAMSESSPLTRGSTAGLVTACLFIGQFVSPVLSQPAISLVGYSGAFYGAALLVLIALVPALALRRRA